MFSRFSALQPLFHSYSPWQTTNGFQREIKGKQLQEPSKFPYLVGNSAKICCLRWRLCHGDLQPSHIEEFILHATSLWELIDLQLHGVVMDTILGFNLSHYAIVRGRGMRRIEQRSMNMVKGNRSYAQQQSKSKGKENKTTRVKEVVLYSNSSK